MRPANPYSPSPTGTAAYAIPQAADYLNVSVNRLRYWAVGGW